MVYTFPERLRLMRMRRAISQKQLAERLNVAQQTVASWEIGTRYPAIDRLFDIARVLECRPAELVEEVDNV